MTTYVKYTGTKPRKTDNFAHTDAVWTPGSIVPMKDADALKCLVAVDIFAVATAAEVMAAGFKPVAADPKPLEAQPLPLEREPEPVEEEKDRVIHQVNLQTMTKPALKLYAAREFNKNFDDTMSIQAMRTEVRNLRIGAGMRNG